MKSDPPISNCPHDLLSYRFPLKGFLYAFIRISVYCTVLLRKSYMYILLILSSRGGGLQNIHFEASGIDYKI